MRRPAIRPSLLLMPVLAVGLAVGCGEDEPVRVWFEEPQDGETVEGPDVQVLLQASGVEIVSADIHREGTAHHHIFVNRDLTPLGDSIPAGVPGIIHMGQGQSDFVLQDLDEGQHRLIAVLADWEHVPLDPPAVDTIFITVVHPEE